MSQLGIMSQGSWARAKPALACLEPLVILRVLACLGTLVLAYRVCPRTEQAFPGFLALVLASLRNPKPVLVFTEWVGNLQPSLMAMSGLTGQLVKTALRGEP